MVKALGSSEEAVFLQHRLDDMNQRWSELKAKSANIRAHLEASAERWSRLLASLEDLCRWLNLKDEGLKKQMPIGGDVPTLQQQHSHCTLPGTTKGQAGQGVLNIHAAILEGQFPGGKLLSRAFPFAASPPIAWTSDCSSSSSEEKQRQRRMQKTMGNFPGCVFGSPFAQSQGGRAQPPL
ncbi:UNVERIFIED_CONTAM: hypothetical protein FKN15_062820 [Acipenser sinensis]